MVAVLDPYHRWLGIPPDEQPAHHYRLLGLAEFEDDPEVIRDAAERQMSHVRGYGLGKHAELSQKILNELGRAKACLLDAEKKKEYDHRLRVKLAASKPIASPGPPPGSRPQAPSGPPPLIEPAAEQLPAAGGEAAEAVGIDLPRPTAGVWNWPLVIGGAAAGLVVLILVGVMTLSGGQDESGTNDSNERLASTGPAKQLDDPARVDAHRPDDDPPASRPLKLAPIENQSVDEGTTLDVRVLLEDVVAPGFELRYELGPDAPEGAEIDAQSGELTWTPSEEHGPGQYLIAVKATAAGSGDAAGRSASCQFHVEVKEANLAPRIHAPMAPQRVEAGGRLAVRVAATDPDLPPNRLTFSLADSPYWANIDPSLGIITFRPTTGVDPGTYPMTVEVTDNQPDSLSGRANIEVVVAKPAGITAPAPRPPVSAGTGSYQLTFPSGQTLDTSAFGTNRSQLDREIGRLLDEQRGVVPRGAQYSIKHLLHPNESIRALMSCRADGSYELDGSTITFFPSQRAAGYGRYQPPASPYPPLPPRGPGPPARRPSGSSTARSLPPRGPGPPGPSLYPPAGTLPPVSPANLTPRMWVNYADGNKDGWLRTWNAAGQKEYWCQYLHNNRNGLCCLFENDELRMVLECSSFRVDAFHLVSGDKVLKTFEDSAEIESDDVGGPLWKRLAAIEAQVKQEEIDLKKEKRELEERERSQRSRQLGPQKRRSIVERQAERDRKEKEFHDSLRRKAMNR